MANVIKNLWDKVAIYCENHEAPEEMRMLTNSEVTKIMGTALSGTVKTGRYSSKAASLSVSKMSELASKGFDKGDERALVR